MFKLLLRSTAQLALCSAMPVLAQDRPPVPHNSEATDTPPPRVECAPIDRAELLAQDASSPDGPARVAIVQPFYLDSRVDGLLEALEDGSHLWTVRVRTPGAAWMRLVLDDWNPGADSELVVYDPNHPIASRRSIGSSRSSREFWSPVLFSGDVALEYRMAPLVDPHAEVNAVRMSQIVCGYRGFDAESAAGVDGANERGGPRGGDPLPCHHDPTCWTRSAELYEGIGMWLRCSGTACFQCSGSLINREYQFAEPPLGPLDYGDDAALFLTASHCGATTSNLHTIVVIFGFHTTNCNSTPPDLNSLHQSRVIANLFSVPDVDVQLLGLESYNLPSTRNPVLLDWWATPYSTVDAMSIYHPIGSYMRLADCTKSALALDSRSARQTDGSCNDASNYLIRFDSFARPEPGAEGAPVFRYRADHEYQPIMAVLSCRLTGTPNCEDVTSYSGARLDYVANAMQPFRIPLDTVYVDNTHTGTERGTEAEPMRTVARGAFVVRQLAANPRMLLAPGNYSAGATLDFRCIVRLADPSNSAVIGQ